ncbi:Sporulation related domain-containing protein [Epibacterium ulvae]|uniref:Sporulation related domain-containing protein n=1 Tax=Epibacterium ulvae TaxID=1156985 RepID=A0A1G5PZC7_9RHOB|nr:SPOR domain-containing protein [Epibacterium ulvae]SCZ54954.1 Sporulation related domain-containing protein [Epibacterium ulvae]
MKITRIIALGIVAGTLGWTEGTAQSLRNSGPPAEIPPSSYTGRQYVDSRGCVYIRAGIDGAVNWVPRVARSRQQLCGFEPTQISRAQRAAAPSTSSQPELITLPEADRPGGQAVAVQSPAPAQPTRRATTPAVPRQSAPVVRRPAATAVPQKPRRTAPAPVVRQARQPQRRVQQPAPQAQRRVLQPAPIAPRPSAAAPAAGTCPGASAISQQYINKTGVRCGPQAQSPVSYGDGSGIGPQSSLTPNTRVLPTHVYQQRRQAADVTVPAGYRTVWQDDRLNPRRAEGAFQPSRAIAGHSAAYQSAFQGQDRFNPQRGRGGANGDSAMARVWKSTVPRTLIPAPVDKQIVRRVVPRGVFEATPEPLTATNSFHISTRSASEAVKSTPRYIRAATFADAQAASAALQRVRGAGLPARLGRVTRNGQSYKVVLAGPFQSKDRAQDALNRVRGAGFSGARMSN